MINDNYFCRRIASQKMLPAECRCLTKMLPKEGRSRPAGECPTTPLSDSDSLRLCSPIPGRQGLKMISTVGQLGAPA